MDVGSLYTNIPIGDGLEACRIALDTYRSATNIKPKNETLIKLLEIVLKKNNFQFNGVNYLQVGGTAMGTKVAPSFAITYMGAFEEKFVYTYRLQPLIYVRYIDDIFMIWQHGKAELEQFFNHMNNCSPHIKFTTETSEEAIAFLDTLVRLENNCVTTDLYSKPTDSHNYLYYNSAHPQCCKDSIPYSQFLRIRRICSSKAAFDEHVVSIAQHFLRRKYPLELIQEAALLARNLTRDELLAPRANTDGDGEKEKVFLITTYHPDDQSVPAMARDNWPILGRNQTTDILHNKKLTCGYRRPKNLRDILCKARVKHLPGDEIADPQYVPPPPPVVTAIPTVYTGTNPLARTRQTSIREFASRCTPSFETPTEARTKIPVPTNPHSGKNRGYSFCPKTGCRYCL